jgi:hypothetical protein
MKFAVVEGGSGLGGDDLGLDVAEAKGSERPASQGRQELFDGHLLVHADDAQGFVPGPGADGDLLDHALDVDKANLAKDGLDGLGDEEVHAELCEGLVKQLICILQGVIFGHAAVIAEDLSGEFLEL